ncbi:GTP-binding protein [Chondromyces crocatus]|uniref:Gliding motility protein n=1 Tax=Chondromyces crocatus TaxID=52 RepID=A0A0K1E932_CHOCO|nr:GTPase domain-containing protein [Chondromyces crocatus]AKT37364.1 gliding motility protein [Chondromyces crocatus]
MELDFTAREVQIKLVYYGPALSGKTTNLEALHSAAGADARGRLMTLNTQDDRTLFFDLLPLTFRSKDGDVSLRIKLFTVPGQPMHAATRRLVLKKADGVALIADSRIAATQSNADSFFDLRENLEENGQDLSEMALVIQFNKRDLPEHEIRSDDELEKLAARGREPVYKAIATRGIGTVETFMGLLHLTWEKLDNKNQLSKRMSISGDDLLASAARQLGVTGPVADILAKRMGGNFDRSARIVR